MVRRHFNRGARFREMKKIDVGRVTRIIGNVSVIAGIVFLAFELRQNNSYGAKRVLVTARRLIG